MCEQGILQGKRKIYKSILSGAVQGILGISCSVYFCLLVMEKLLCFISNSYAPMGTIVH